MSFTRLSLPTSKYLVWVSPQARAHHFRHQHVGLYRWLWCSVQSMQI